MGRKMKRVRVPVGRKMKRVRVPVKKIDPNSFLTKLVLRKAKRLPDVDKRYFELYLKSKRLEFLPDGIPYKVIDPYKVVFWVNRCMGTFVQYLNKPLILVSMEYPFKLRQIAARHEYDEWAITKRSEFSKLGEERTSHKRALKRASHNLLNKNT